MYAINVYNNIQKDKEKVKKILIFIIIIPN